MNGSNGSKGSHRVRKLLRHAGDRGVSKTNMPWQQVGRAVRVPQNTRAKTKNEEKPKIKKRRRTPRVKTSSNSTNQHKPRSSDHRTQREQLSAKIRFLKPRQQKQPVHEGKNPKNQKTCQRQRTLVGTKKSQQTQQPVEERAARHVQYYKKTRHLQKYAVQKGKNPNEQQHKTKHRTGQTKTSTKKEEKKKREGRAKKEGEEKVERRRERREG